MRLSKTIHYATLLAAVVGCIFTVFISNQIFALRCLFEMARYERQISDRAFHFYSLATQPARLISEPGPPPQWKLLYKEANALISKSLILGRTAHEKKPLLAIQKDFREASYYFEQFLASSRRTKLTGPSFSAIQEQIKLRAIRIRNLADRLAFRHEGAADTQLRISLTVTALFLCSVLGFTGIAIFWSHFRFFLPLKALQVAAEKILGGDFQYRPDPSRKDEIGHLSKTMEKMTNHLLELKKRIELEAQEKLQAQHELLDIQETERKRMGQDLHDGITQRLVALSFMSQLAEKKLAEKRTLDAEVLRNLTNEIKKTLEETRQMAHSFYPVDLQHCGLASALRNLAHTFTSTFRIRCDFVCPEEQILDDPEIEAHLYRIAQEAIHNAVRHGNATEIRLEYGKRHAAAFLSITDNGKGFSPGNNGIQHGIGFQSMYYRAALIHGTISIETRKNRGTRITVRCPLKLPHLHLDIPTAHPLNFPQDKHPLI